MSNLPIQLTVILGISLTTNVQLAVLGTTGMELSAPLFPVPLDRLLLEPPASTIFLDVPSWKQPLFVRAVLLDTEQLIMGARSVLEEPIPFIPVSSAPQQLRL